MIVLTTSQKESLCNILNQHKDSLISNGIWVNPVEIKNNLWILPESVLNDDRLYGIKSLVEHKLNSIVYREIEDNEFIKFENI